MLPQSKSGLYPVFIGRSHNPFVIALSIKLMTYLKVLSGDYQLLDDPFR